MPSIEAIINRQFLIWDGQKERTLREPRKEVEILPIVTVSRQAGSRGSYFASRLAERINYQRLHREVIDAICQSSGYRKQIVESIDYHVRGSLDLAFESVITGQSVDLSDYTRHLFQVVLSMSKLGGVIVMGRGSNFILGPLKGVHFRIIAPMDVRMRNLMKYKDVSESEVKRAIELSDNERRTFIRKVFNKDIEDPHHYDVVYNSALIDVEEMVQSAEIAIKTKLDKLAHQYAD